MANFEEVRQTIELGVVFTEASAEAMDVCFGNANLAGATAGGVRRTAGELEQANLQATSGTSAALALARVALGGLQAENGLPETTVDEPVLLTAAASLNEAFEGLALAGSLDNDTLAGEQGVWTMQALASKGAEYSKSAATAADLANDIAYQASAKYSEVKPDDPTAIAAIEYQKLIKSLADDVLGSLISTHSTL